MGKYRINIEDAKVKDCMLVKKGSYDDILITQYGSFVHITPESHNIVAYLCKAPSEVEALIKAQKFLED